MTLAAGVLAGLVRPVAAVAGLGIWVPGLPAP